MAQINLLKQPTQASDLWEKLPKFLVRGLAVILVFLVGYYGWLYFQSKKIDGEIIDLQSKINTDAQAAFNAPRRAELLTRQLQLKDLNSLIAAHVYFSKLMPKLAKATLSDASYSSLKVGQDGLLVLSVHVSSLENLDRYLQVFDLPDVNKYFSDVRISSYHKVQGKDSTGISFQITMKYNGGIISYDKGNN